MQIFLESAKAKFTFLNTESVHQCSHLIYGVALGGSFNLSGIYTAMFSSAKQRLFKIVGKQTANSVIGNVM